MLDGTLKLAVESCHALVEIEDVKSDHAVLLHERVKSLYQNVMVALASGRIYYWIRYLKGATSDELNLLISPQDENSWHAGAFALLIALINALVQKAICRATQTVVHQSQMPRNR
ncbi:MAG TPA: hypothetical protein VJ691_13630 [Vicinamibacterales bacterium]|nr:hypothetical protein [Vicinamibacterales bacterium]